jgi:triacylglycerol lipase
LTKHENTPCLHAVFAGLYGFSTATPIPLFPSLKLHYWASVLEVLRERLGVKVIVVGVKGTGSIEERARGIHAFLEDKVPKGTGLNFVAHSMVGIGGTGQCVKTGIAVVLTHGVFFFLPLSGQGGLDCRYLISHLKPTTYKPLSLTMIGTPNRGSPFMDWCAVSVYPFGPGLGYS